jgi:protein-tyrosine phosphatase
VAADAFSLAFVCTGNRFRSPLAAAVAADAAAGLPVTVESAGLLELEGWGALDEAVAAGAALGLDLSAHRCRQLTQGSLSGSDLVVGFERKHANAAVSDGGANVARVFTLPEAVGLLERVDRPPDSKSVARARALVRRAHELRGVETKHSQPVEIPDPLGQADAFQRRIAESVADLSRRLVAGLFETTGRITPP